MIGVGIIGLGTVGIGTYKILTEYHELLKERTGLDIRVVKIADVDLERDRGIKIDRKILTKDAYELIDDRHVDIVVELIGGTTYAYEYIVAAIKKKKWIVTANKALLAEKGDEIFTLVEKEGCEIGFEASVCGGIPIIRVLRDGLIGNKITYLLGILNGTSNYILTKMADEGINFNAALKEAQRLGYAEQDPTLDIEGIDAAHKLSILIRLAFNCSIKMGDITTRGISKIEPVDIFFAKEFGYKIKLLALAKEEMGLIDARVEPTMISLNHPLSNVAGVYNGVYVVGDRVGPTLYYGKGAGSEPTGSSIVSDIADMATRIKQHSQKAKTPNAIHCDFSIMEEKNIFTPYYIRVNAHDRPGVLSKISGILGEHDISISTVVQKGRVSKGYVPVMMITHEAKEKDLMNAKRRIDQLPFIKGESIYIRIEQGLA